MIMENKYTPGCPPDPDYFTITPCRLFLGVVIHTFMRTAGPSCRKIGFARFIGHFIQSQDKPYLHIMKSLSKYKLGPIKFATEEKLASIKVQGVGGLIDIISNLKIMAEENDIHKTSVCGFFVRRLVVFVDRLSFTAIDALFGQFKAYIDADKSIEIDNQTEGKQSKKLPPKLASLELNKQINLISVNDKQAMNPKELEVFMQDITRNDKTMERMLQSLQKQQQIMSEINDGVSRKRLQTTASDISSQVEFVRFVNCLRIKDYSGAKQALVSFFDTTTSASCCWSVYNLARLDFYFGHDDNCLNAIKECIDYSQASNDEECLEFCLLLLAKLLIKKTSEESPDLEDIAALLSHLTTKGINCEIPLMSVISSLHLEQLLLPTGKSMDTSVVSSPAKATPRTNSNNPPTVTQNSNSCPEVTAVRHSLNEVLPMVYSNRSAHMTHFGETSLCNLSSQLLLSLNAVSRIGRNCVHYVDSNTAIAVRNVALLLWRNYGDAEMTVSMLRKLNSSLFTFYSDNQSILEKIGAVIDFEHHLFQNNFKEARKALDKLALYDQDEYRLQNIRFLEKKGDYVGALKQSTLLDKSRNSFLSTRAKMAKAKLLKNITMCEECIESIEEKNMIGLRNESFLLLASLQTQEKHHREAIASLRKITLSFLTNGSLREIGMHHYLMAFNLKNSAEKVDGDIESALQYNQRALDYFSRLNDVDNLKDSLTLHAFLHHELGNRDQRNYCAKQVRLLTNCI